MSSHNYQNNDLNSIGDVMISDAKELETIRPLPRVSIHAFCESDKLQKIMEQCASDRRMAKVNMRITNGNVIAAATMFETSPTPNLIFVETKAAPSEVLNELAPLAQVCDPATKVIVIGYHNDIDLYRELMRNGISEYMMQPITLSSVMKAISAIFTDPESDKLGKSIAFIGAKGGVGASTISHNCAYSISSLFETETILADLDLPFGTANIDFDQDPSQGIADAVFAPDRLDETFLDRLLTKCSDNLSMLAAPSTLSRTYDFDVNSFRPLLDVLQKSAPISVLDVPHQWSEWTKSLLGTVDEVVIVATPDLANLRNTKNLLDNLRKMRPNDKSPYLILNQVGVPKRPEISIANFCDPLEVEPIANIAFDPVLFGNAANSGQMISEMDIKAPPVQQFSEIAHVVTGRTTIKKAKKDKVLSFLRRK